MALPISKNCTTCDLASAKSTEPDCVECIAGKPSDFPNWRPKKPARKEAEK